MAGAHQLVRGVLWSDTLKQFRADRAGAIARQSFSDRTGRLLGAKTIVVSAVGW